MFFKTVLLIISYLNLKNHYFLPLSYCGGYRNSVNLQKNNPTRVFNTYHEKLL